MATTPLIRAEGEPDQHANEAPSVERPAVVVSPVVDHAARGSTAVSMKAASIAPSVICSPSRLADDRTSPHHEGSAREPEDLLHLRGDQHHGHAGQGKLD